VDGNGKKKNRLASSQSPYLIQHAENPVDWYPWGDEALARARAEDRPIFLSIGYSACHWCHVMAHESFADPAAASLLNQHFINIKVDREERPDLDQTYMTACQLITGGGGWPLSVFLTPELKPFYAATYIPKRSRLGRAGLMELVPRLMELWNTQRERIENAAREIADTISRPRIECVGEMPGERNLAVAFEQLQTMFDNEHGGFGDAPKFPTPHNLTFLLRRRLRTGEARPLEMVEKTLGEMRRGGIYDHLGRGFHRYSTDARWLVPHFEKMLYDQAQLVEAYVEAWQVTGKLEYQDTARETLSYVLRDLADPQGGFHSAEDADSEGEEGKFYLWTTVEVRGLLPEDEADAFIRIFGLEDDGNFADKASGEETGRNIIHLAAPFAERARALGFEPETAARLAEGARRKLWRAREDRARPGKDDKVLCDWNGLMIGALAQAGRAFGETAFVRAADKAARFIRAFMREPGGTLYHRWRKGEPGIPGFLDDYAFLIHGLTELYQAGFDLVHLQDAVAYTRYVIEHFTDESGGFFFTSDAEPGPLGRRKDAYDGATPSGNSMMALNLLRLSRLLAEPSFAEQAERIFRAFGCDLARSPAGYTRMLAALDFALAPGVEVVVVGRRNAADTRALLQAAGLGFHPGRVTLLKPTDDPSSAEELGKLAGHTRDLVGQEGKAVAYVCGNWRCHQPTSDPEEVKKLIAAGG